MSNRYKKTFEQLKKEKRIGFCPFAVLGHPNFTESLERIKTYLKVKPDILELGIPFSDPIADGQTIQAADEEALKNGLTPKKALNLIAQIRQLTSIPIGILTYSNIVLAYGIKKFYHDLKQAEVDSILIADLPLEEIKLFAHYAQQNELNQILIVSEYTSNERLKAIEKFASGFLYVVSTLGITGARKKLSTNLKMLIKRLRKSTSLPLMVGFGISSPEHIKTVGLTGVEGAIVGSALIKVPQKDLFHSLKSLKDACS